MVHADSMCDTGRLPFQVRDFERHYGLMNSLAGACYGEGTNKASRAIEGLEWRRANGLPKVLSKDKSHLTATI